VLEGDLPIFEKLDQLLVDHERRRAGRQTKHKRTLGGRLEIVDALDHVASNQLADVAFAIADHEAHSEAPRPTVCRGCEVGALGRAEQ